MAWNNVSFALYVAFLFTWRIYISSVTLNVGYILIHQSLRCFVSESNIGSGERDCVECQDSAGLICNKLHFHMSWSVSCILVCVMPTIFNYRCTCSLLFSKYCY